MNFIERKYILLLSNRFRNFKQKENHYNFSCPYCGDSHKNKFKARGIYYKKVQNGCIIAIIVVQPGVLISF